MLPELVEPRILDIGCGSGASTLELARLSGGDIVAVDIDKEALDKLVKKAEIEGLSSRVTVVHSSMLEMDFPSNSFDIIWSEGAISYIGFERGLREWRGLLVPDGYLVIHDAMSDLHQRFGWTQFHTRCSVRDHGFRWQRRNRGRGCHSRGKCDLHK